MARITIKAITPKSKFLVDPRFLRSELFNALDHTANIVRDDFNKTIRTWNNKPTFRKVGPRRKITRMEVEVFTNNEIYFYVTRGTRAHPIVGKVGGGRGGRPGTLSFRKGFTSKSRVRIIGSRAGRSFGPRVFTPAVYHPGTKAREFDKEIARRRQKNLNNLVRLALLRAIKHSAS